MQVWRFQACQSSPDAAGECSLLHKSGQHMEPSYLPTQNSKQALTWHTHTSYDALWASPEVAFVSRQSIPTPSLNLTQTLTTLTLNVT